MYLWAFKIHIHHKRKFLVPNNRYCHFLRILEREFSWNLMEFVSWKDDQSFVKEKESWFIAGDQVFHDLLHCFILEFFIRNLVDLALGDLQLDLEFGFFGLLRLVYHALSDIRNSNLNKVSHLYLIFIKSGFIYKLLIVMIKMECSHMLLG